LGGNADDEGNGIAVDDDGNTYVTGMTGSSDFPTVNPYKATHSSTDAFVTKINPSGSAIIYSTYLGGVYSINFSNFDQGIAIAVDTLGNAYIAGETAAINFPMVNAIQPDFGGGSGDIFISKLSADGSSLLFSTYLGGNGLEEYPRDITLDHLGNIYITGETKSSNFPTNNALHSTLNGDIDAFITQITTNGSHMPFSTYLGGSNFDNGYGITADKY
ncbi:MAG: SBBP repeat-containing protein, partial [Ignavibacteriaceae bacterium]